MTKSTAPPLMSPPTAAWSRAKRTVWPRMVSVALAGLTATACGGAADAVHRSPPASSSGYGSYGIASTKVAQAASAEASTVYRHDVGAASASFVADIGVLQAAAESGNLVAAKAEELAAQADYDRFRMVEGGYAVTASTIDELATDVVPGTSFAGLHAVERDLWTSGDTAGDLSSLAAQAPVAEYLLLRVFPKPDAIAATGVKDLNWVNTVAIPGREEQFSHLDAVDIAATVGAAADAFAAIEPLGRDIAPVMTASVAQRFAALESEVASIGTPTQVPDSSFSTAERLSLSQQVDATAAGLSQLAATLTPFGTSGWPS